MKKRFFLAAMTLLVSMGAFAQGNGIAGISEAKHGHFVFRSRNQVDLRHRRRYRPYRGREGIFQVLVG